ncbi:hypothetical protein CI610_03230 [invertebrate metagenome]|uniref:Uncharacterized protein n=1 Tax=invertebrate metagenome TaxID=1711999 RepID=A0A2H9T3P3_9ZZZZ
MRGSYSRSPRHDDCTTYVTCEDPERRLPGVVLYVRIFSIDDPRNLCSHHRLEGLYKDKHNFTTFFISTGPLITGVMYLAVCLRQYISVWQHYNVSSTLSQGYKHLHTTDSDLYC